MRDQSICISLVRRRMDLSLVVRGRPEQPYNTKSRRTRLRVPKLSRNMIRSLST